MTLEEAHNIQRRELISLRAENKRLQKKISELNPDAEREAALSAENKKLRKQLDNLFPSKKQESLERHIRYLNQQIDLENRRHELARNNWKLTDKRCYDLEIENIGLKKQVESLKAENAALRHRAETAEAEVQMLNGTKKKLEKQLNTNFENSSLPSSALPFRKKVPNSRKPTGRKPGAQPGHKANTAAKLPATKDPVHLPIPAELINNPDVYPTGKTITKQLIDIRVIVDVQDFIADEYRNRITGSRSHAAFPNNLVNEVNYGPSVKALAFLLNNYYNVSIAKTQQCIADLTKGIVSLSAGTICNLSSSFSTATAEDRARIFSLLTHGDILYSDATVSNINGSRKAVILCTDGEHFLYQHLDHKGHDGLSKTPVQNYKGTLIHDHDKTYYSYGRDHQECLAHVLRYLVGAIENEPELKWHKQMHSLLQEIIHASKKHKASLSNERIQFFKNKYDTILELAAAEYDSHPPDVYIEGYKLQKRLRSYKDAHLFFLDHPDVDYTNNVCERGLRKFKRKQKQAVVLRSDQGGENICDALSIIETARSHNKNVFDVVESAFIK